MVFTCVTDTGRLKYGYIALVNNSLDYVLFSLHFNHVKTTVTVQIFKLELIIVTGIDNKTYVFVYLVIIELPLCAWIVSTPTLL